MAPLKRQRRCRRQTNAGLVFLVALLLALVSPELARADSEPAPLQLEISMNGFALNVMDGLPRPAPNCSNWESPSLATDRRMN